MTASFEIALQHLAGNPILLKFNITPGLTVGYRIMEFESSEPIYTALVTSITSSITVNINKLFRQSAVGDGVKKYTIVMFYGVINMQTAHFEVYPGAISKRLHRELAKNSLTIFNTKLNPSDQNFLLSTRSFGRVIPVPEDELLPIPFYRHGKVFQVLGQNFDYSADTQGVEFFNPNLLRKNYFTASSKLTNILEIKSGTDTAATVLITEASKKHHYFIKFRNSLGAQEMIALDSEIDFRPEFEHRDIGVYDRLTGDVINVPFSVAHKSKYLANLRTLRADETLFALDMLLSREQYLVTPEGEFQVIVRTGEQTFQTTSGQPLTIPVEIETVEEERYYSPIDMERLSLIYENIFTQEFTLHFT